MIIIAGCSTTHFTSIFVAKIRLGISYKEPEKLGKFAPTFLIVSPKSEGTTKTFNWLKNLLNVHGE